MDPFFDGAPVHSEGTLPLDHEVSISDLFKVVKLDTHDVLQKLHELQKGGVSIADMFEMQLVLNHLAQMSELSRGITASNSAILNLARNIKA